MTTGAKLVNGFTLIEVLVVIGVFATVGIIISTILVTSLRGNSKTNTIIDVKEEGNHALFFMTQAIRYAKQFNGMTDGTIDPVTEKYKLYHDCTVYPVGAGVPTPTPAYYKGVKITAFDGQESTFICCSDGTIAALSGTLTCDSANKNLLFDSTSVSMPTCSLTCSQRGSSDFPAIGIHFSLIQANLNALVEKAASAGAIPFETSVTMRNFYK